MGLIKAGNTAIDNEMNKVVKQIAHEIGSDQDFKVIEEKNNKFKLEFTRLDGTKVKLPNNFTTIYDAVMFWERFQKQLYLQIKKIKEDAVMLLINGPVIVEEVNSIVEESLSVNEMAELTNLPVESFQVGSMPVEIIDHDFSTDTTNEPIVLMENISIENATITTEGL